MILRLGPLYLKYGTTVIKTFDVRFYPSLQLLHHTVIEDLGSRHCTTIGILTNCACNILTLGSKLLCNFSCSRMRCLNLSWICCWCCDCFSGFCNRKQNNCKCNSCRPSINCSVRNWCYCCDKKSHCCKDFCGCNNCCCTLPGCNFRWPFSSCCVCKCSCSCTCPSFPKFPSCCCCTKC